METIFDYLTQEQQDAGNELFDEFVSDWDLRSTTLEEAFKIGYARGAGVEVPHELPNAKLCTAPSGEPK